MVKIAIATIVGVSMLLTILLGCGGLGLAVREGVTPELLFWFPPNTRYQIILRVGRDALPWDRSANRPTAINLWAHGRGTDWHLVRVVHVPLGQPSERRE